MATGRIEEVIDRGGEKVNPSEVDAAVLGHPDVVDAAAFPVPHPTLGAEVAVAVVQAPGAGLTDQTLTEFLLGRLAGFKVPRRIFFVDAIPRNDAGQVQRFRLAESLGASTETPTLGAKPPVREASPLEEKLRGIWARALRAPEVGLDDNFFLLGGDSLQAVEMFLEIEKTLGRRLPRSALFSAGTVAEMARMIGEGERSDCIVPIQPEGDKPPFFCIHDGNGQVLNFRPLADHLAPDRPFYGIQCLGLDGTEGPFTEIEAMADHYLREIRKVRPSGPYHLGGYSFGGRVAYVMAQKLRARGETPGVLALLDTTSLLDRRGLTPGRWARRHLSRLKKVSPAELPAYIGMRFTNAASYLRRRLYTPLYGLAVASYRTRGRDLPSWLYRPVEANALIRRNTVLTPYGGDAVLFQTAESRDSYLDQANGWSRLVGGRLEIVPVPGQHYQIVREPHVRTLAARLSEVLDSA